MAEALLSPLFQVILENLNSHAFKDFGALSGLKADIDTLKSNFTAIQAVLQDAESKQWTSESVKDWLKKLKYVAYDLESVLDKVSTEALIRTMNHRRGFKHRLYALFLYRSPIVFQIKIINKVKEIKKRLDAIANEKTKFHFKQWPKEAQEVVGVDSRLTSSLVKESEILGRDGEKEMVIDKLINNNLGDDVSVYAIRGMGGLGKTTLAQLVYNDERIKSYFDLKIWVCVSDDFSIKRLIRAIIESIDGSHCSITELDPLQLRLQEKLKGRRYLIILDDVWNEIHENWEGLKHALYSAARGSTIIVTTRLETVARMMATFEVHQMGYLSEDDSWCLFKRRAFGIQGMEENIRLEAIGKEIVKKCGGLPLAIKALGSLMRLKRGESQWLFVKESKIWELSGDGSSILPALRLSFDNLPSYSKRCFAYCCVFPKDYIMERDDLIYFWMANGFLPSRGQSDFYAVGREVFDDLVWRSFFQEVKVEDGEVTCKIHDLMHDLAQFLMGDECLTIDSNNTLINPAEVRHLYFSSQLIPYTTLPKVKYMRTLLLPEVIYEGSVSYKDIFSRFKEVRYLNMRSSRFSSVANNKILKSIGNLIHLRCLDMSYSNIKSLPESICCLQNMQNLILRDCVHLCTLPNDMQYMKSLQCIDIRDCLSLLCMPAGIGQLTRLQTLSIFIVGQARGCRITEIQELDLQGEISIKGLDNVTDPIYTSNSILKNKEKLSDLSLYWRKSSSPEIAEQVLDCLEPHSNVKKLEIYNYPGFKLPNWIMSGMILENLTEICITNCKRCEDVPCLGKLPSLKVLYFEGMCDIKSLDTVFHGDGDKSFLALEDLMLSGMTSLEEWKTTPTTVLERQSFPRLKRLFIWRCPKLIELPSNLPKLEVLSLSKINQVLVGQVINLTSISNLIIESNDEVSLLPSELLKHHKALEHLTFGNLSNLETLSNNLDNLTALKSLTIRLCPSLKFLSKELINLTSLQVMKLYECRTMESITDGVRHLSALQELTIEQCPNMKCLPDGLQNLSELKLLYITKCPTLVLRCKKITGEDWPKIAHIMVIQIDGEIIQNLWP